MFQAARMLYIYVETPLHAGTGRGLGAIDLPIQRERITGYPIIQASSIKGRLRAECYENFWQSLGVNCQEAAFQKILKDLVKKNLNEGSKLSPDELRYQAEQDLRKLIQKEGLEAAFGPDTEHGDEHAGAVSPGDAKILLFPVRSLASVFVWITSVDALSRFFRHADISGLPLKYKTKIDGKDAEIELKLPPSPEKDQAWIASYDVVAADKVVLEEFAFIPKHDHANQLNLLGQWLAEHTLPEGEAHNYWREALPKRLVILHEDAFRDFTQFSTEVVTRIKINQETKTVDTKTGGLWTEESLPTDTLLYSPLMATAPRTPNNGNLSPSKQTAKAMLELIEQMLPSKHIQFGGDETVGRGTVSLRFGKIHEFAPTKTRKEGE